MNTEYHSTENKNPPNRSQLLRDALGAAASGLAVFPVKVKAPRTRHGCKDASTQPQRIHTMFAAAKDATGYGIATGRASGVVVVDVDGPEARAEAVRRGLTSGYVVKTGRPDGWHLYYTIPKGVEVKPRQIAPGIELKGDGSYVVGPGSLHPSGAVYTVAKNGDPGAAPEWIMQVPERGAGNTKSATQPVTVDVAGEPIPEGVRNHTLARIAGRLHDGRRDLEALTRDLLAVNQARCSPPLDVAEVTKIAISIYRRDPCNAAPEVSREVLATVERLQEAADQRPVVGIRGATGWSVYNAGLDLLRHYGREHPDGVELSIDVRTWALAAGTSAATVSKFIRRCPLVSYGRRGSGRRGSSVVFKAPPEKGVKLKHSTTRGVSKEKTTSASVYDRPLFRKLYRLRWGAGRIGKSRAALLKAVVDCPGVSRAELAARLGKKATSLKKPLKWLMDAGLLERVGWGRYAVPGDFTERLDAAREQGREPEADRLQMARHNRQREGYRTRHKRKTDHAPSHSEMEERRGSAPRRRAATITAAIAALFADRPEYRLRRVGQITCALVKYLPDDFVPGATGLPKDAEVEQILDGVAA